MFSSWRLIWLHAGPMRTKYTWNLLLLLVLQIEKYFKRRSAANGLQHHAHSVKRCLFNQLEEAEVEIDLFQDGGQIKIKKNVDHHNTN